MSCPAGQAFASDRNSPSALEAPPTGRLPRKSQIAGMLVICREAS